MKKLMTLVVVLFVFAIITLLAAKNFLFENDTPDSIGYAKKVKEVKTEITFLNGTLNITSVSLNKLYSGDYIYQREEFKPEISYTEENETGYLKIISGKMDEEKQVSTSENNSWDLKFNKDIKTDLYIKMGAGEGTFTLADSRLNRLDFQMIAGEVDINLKNTSLKDLNLKAIAGKVTIDLTGKWNNDLHANITGGAGELLLIIPESTGTEVEITGLLANIYTPGFEKKGHTYTNYAYGKTQETLYIEIFGGIGDIELRSGR